MWLKNCFNLEKTGIGQNELVESHLFRQFSCSKHFLVSKAVCWGLGDVEMDPFHEELTNASGLAAQMWSLQGSINITWELVRNAELRPHPRSAELVSAFL